MLAWSDLVLRVQGNFQGQTIRSAASTDLFSKDKDSPKIEKDMAKDFHTFVAKGLFACKCARPDTATLILVLTT